MDTKYSAGKGEKPIGLFKILSFMKVIQLKFHISTIQVMKRSSCVIEKYTKLHKRKEKIDSTTNNKTRRKKKLRITHQSKSSVDSLAWFTRLVFKRCLKILIEDEDLAMRICVFQSKEPLSLMENWL